MKFEAAARRSLEAILVNLDKSRLDETGATDGQKAAWFALASNCSAGALYYKIPPGLSEVLDNVSPSLCRTIPLNYRKNPVTLLRMGSDNTSAELALLRAENLIVAARLSEVDGAHASAQRRRAMLEEAETLGSQAASRGVERAFLFMAQQYESGGFEKKDLRRAYVFLSAMQSVEDSADNRERLDYVYQQMTATDYKDMTQAIARCARPRMQWPGVVLANPFR